MLNLRKKLKILAAAFLVLSAAVLFLGCEAEEFDGAGSAQVIITMDRHYEGLTVSCPEGEIQSSNLVYTVSLKSLAVTDIVLFSEGYEPMVLRFYTDDLKSGHVERSVTLEKKRIFVNITMLGVSDYSEVTVTGGSNFLGFTSTERGITAELTESDTAALTFSSPGFYKNTFTVASEMFLNYRANIRVPMLPVGTDSVAVTIINDLPKIGYGWNLNVSYLEYSQQLQNVYLTNGDAVVYLKRGRNYKISSGSNSVVLGALQIERAFAEEKPYIQINASSAVNLSAETGQAVSVKLSGEFSKEVKERWNNFQMPFEFYSASGNLLDIWSSDQPGVYITPAYPGTEALILLRDQSNVYALYRHTFTQSDAQDGFVLQNKVDDLLVDLSFELEDGSPFGGADMRWWGNSQEHMLSQFEPQDEVIVQGSLSSGNFTLDCTKLVTDYRFRLNGIDLILGDSSDNHVRDFRASFFSALIRGGEAAFVVTKKADIRINFFHNGAAVRAEDVISGLLPEYTDDGQSYIIGNMGDGENFNIPVDSGFMYLSTIKFDKAIFDYVDGYYNLDVHLVQVYRLKLNLTVDGQPFAYGSEAHVNFSAGGLYASATWLYDRDNPQQGYFEVTLQEDFIDKNVRIECYFYGDYYQANIKLTLEMLESGELTVNFTRPKM